MTELSVIGSPIAVVEGEIKSFTFIWPYDAVSSGVTYAYKNGVDVSSSCLTGSEATTANSQTLRLFTPQSGWGGSKIVLVGQVDTAGGARHKAKLVCKIQKVDDEP